MTLPRARQTGFTLVEVIIATTLAAMVMAGLVTAVRAFGSSLTRTEERVEQIDEMRLTSEFLRQILGAPVPNKRRTLPDGSTRVYFDGQPAAVQMLGSLPARNGLGGLHALQVHLREQGGDTNLVLEYVPYANNDRMAKLETAEPTLIVDRVDSLHFSYHDAEKWEWKDEWADPDHLPDQMQVDIVRLGHRWPTISIALRPVGGAQ